VPRYQLWRSEFGHAGEVFLEAEYESYDTHVATWNGIGAHPKFVELFRGMTSHVIPGMTYDYALENVDV
jgi:hypothetical protein